MKIGIIGSGNIGGNLGKHWAKAGHQVLFSSRHPKSLNSLVKEAGENATAVSVTDAFESEADVYVLAVPFKALDEIAEQFAGEYGNKVIIDATNPYPERDGEVAEKVRKANYNASEYTAMKFSTASTAKAFNTIYAEHLRDGAFRESNKISIPFAAQDQASKALTKRLIEDIGFDALYVGNLSDSNIMDPNQAIYGKSLKQKELKALVDATKPYGL
ncbi:NADPH-dependent F420 reductase [Mariniflexile ostreae]|uniref:NADPH-dependent F420 reductase n=1 Tax=Mariniflexile ostreae TaxID=1520892 RepID=A0ABV5F8Q5_9FLAO